MPVSFVRRIASPKKALTTVAVAAASAGLASRPHVRETPRAPSPRPARVRACVRALRGA
ncbi:hypothetical protein ACFQ9Z_05490 [Streptomyces sp. NPDC056580]|uniref:hypothetical protein n=1 Tax=Streptomyces sp. NPDC056580 TaxID=3345872 RepID=UPI0036913274